MFRDSITIEIKAGDGGDGISSMGPFKKPDGGDGGIGGNIILRGTNSRYDLSHVRNDNLYQAKPGERGGKNTMTGAAGDDKVIDVPLATLAYDEFGNLMAEITEHNQTVVIAEGGKGGKGNYTFRGSREYGNWTKFTKGEVINPLKVKLILELQSDAIFIGYPNAGKSSVLREVTNADAKVAPYAFTTIDPQKGRYHDMTFLDLPGLIEGTYEGKGLGTSFVKHTKRTKFIVHFISFEEVDMHKSYISMRDELENISPELASKTEIIVLSKSDEASDIEESIQEFKKYSDQVFAVSVLDEKSLDEFAAGVLKLVESK